ncbi:hypothetical protein HBI23_027670 [Parastagonospora nodorum]|nr:hypothetical protein HBI09_011560 [Parastagonospora nodorum]KAH4823377.1 hypothetical protein HBH61_011830 [Parastagonospora nodorum]KAH4914141.1 hypothetical protein HBH74_153510 [Parastagonospora nodorum]KAH4945403.1 hypothetical protein HBI79_011390 [Parastagonospora nodorum]KAH4965097.1 hypothetical protein HBI78_105940 [Parastagonospora nodorum]
MRIMRSSNCSAAVTSSLAGLSNINAFDGLTGPETRLTAVSQVVSWTHETPTFAGCFIPGPSFSIVLLYFLVEFDIT